MKILALLSTLLLATVTVTGCSPGSEDPAQSAQDSVASSSPDDGTAVLPFIADDYPRALAEARERGLPLFVESWAPW